MQAEAAVDWVADYLRSVGELPVLAPGPPRRDSFRPSLLRPPRTGSPSTPILEDFRSTILPGITHWNHPAFFAWFANTGPSGPGIIAEFLAAALNSNAMVWKSSPAGTELEIQMWRSGSAGSWGLPEGFEGTINDTASHSTLYALGAAREVAFPRGPGDRSVGSPLRGRIYTSEEAHSSVEKA